MNTPADKTAKRLSANEVRGIRAPSRPLPEIYKRAVMSAPADKIARRA